MISHRYLALASLSVASLLSVGALPATKKISTLERLLSNDVNVIEEAKDELIATRRNLIEGLIKIVNQKENRIKREASVRAAIIVLGEMRAVEAVELLVDNIGFPYVMEPWSEPRPGPPAGMGTIGLGLSRIQKTYPAVGALVKIGEPCLNAVINKIASTENVNEQKACLGVLINLKPRNSVICMLEDAANKETDTKKKDRLQHSLDMLKRLLEQ
jgi:hypothetical protein